MLLIQHKKKTMSNDENTDQNKNTYSQQGYQKNKCSEEESFGIKI